MNELKQCTRCVLDTSVKEIDFDSDGVCNYCRSYDELMKNMPSGKEAEQELKKITQRIKNQGKRNTYDCIIGLSGGVDSTFLADLVVKLGLKPLAVHVDTGWNSEIAVKNIENAVKKLNLDLYTYVIDWEEMKDLQLSFFKASVPDCDVPQDHVFPAILHRIAKKFKIKNIISGHNNVTEYIIPRSWSYDSNDFTHISDIQSKFGTLRLKKYPRYTLFNKIWYFHVNKIRSWRLLNYVSYNKAEIKKYISNQLGWRDYGGKHYESRFTKFFQAYYLPEKFGIDKRKAHLSNLIVSGQITRDEALKELSLPLYDRKELEGEIEYIIRKLCITKEEWEKIMQSPPCEHSKYKSDKNLLFYKVYKFVSKRIK